MEVVSVVDTVVESAEVEVLLELQAAADKEIANAKKPNLNDFFIFVDYYLSSETLLLNTSTIKR